MQLSLSVTVKVNGTEKPRINSWPVCRFRRTFSSTLALLTTILLVFKVRYQITVVNYSLKSIACSVLYTTRIGHLEYDTN